MTATVTTPVNFLQILGDGATVFGPSYSAGGTQVTMSTPLNRQALLLKGGLLIGANTSVAVRPTPSSA